VVITTQPQSQTVAVGGSVQFTVTASGLPAPTYQWYFKGNIFNGATASILSLNNVQNSDAGDYTVVVSNSLGSVTSNKATLTVTPGGTSLSTPSSGGGGGAVSIWFLLALLVLAVARTLTGRRRPSAIFLQSE